MARSPRSSDSPDAAPSTERSTVTGIPTDDLEQAGGIPVQRTTPTASGQAAAAHGVEGELLPPASRPVRAAAVPSPIDVAVGVATLTLGVARSAADVGALAGRIAVARLPVPAFLRARARRAWLAVGRTGEQELDALRTRFTALVDAVVPEVVREVLARIDVAGLVGDFVDLDRIVDRVDLDRAIDRVDLDAVVSRVDIDRILDRIDLDQVVSRVDLDAVVARVDIDRILDRVDVDQVVAKVDLDPIVDRVNVDRAAARLDLDPILERADIVGLARYVIDAIDLPGLIRSSTGSVTADVVHGVRVRGADADEVVQRVVDRMLRRRGNRDLPAPRRESDDPR